MELLIFDFVSRIKCSCLLLTFCLPSDERDSIYKTYLSGLTECTAPASDKVVFDWSIGKWDNDPDVIDRYIVYWFPYENEKAKTDKIFEIKQWDRQPNAGRFDDYEDVMVAENKKDDDFMYIGPCFTLMSRTTGLNVPLLVSLPIDSIVKCIQSLQLCHK